MHPSRCSVGCLSENLLVSAHHLPCAFDFNCQVAWCHCGRCELLSHPPQAQLLGGSYLCAGVPLHAVLKSELAPEQLRTALASIPLASVALHDSVSTLPPETVSAIVSALAGSAATITALHGFPLVAAREGPGVSLAALTQLRTLNMRQTLLRSPARLQASQLPASIEQLTFTGVAPHEDPQDDEVYSPELIGFHKLRNLLYMTFADQHSWELMMLDDDSWRQDPMHLPPNLQVCLAVEPVLRPRLLCPCAL